MKVLRNTMSVSNAGLKEIQFNIPFGSKLHRVIFEGFSPLKLKDEYVIVWVSSQEHGAEVLASQGGIMAWEGIHSSETQVDASGSYVIVSNRRIVLDMGGVTLEGSKGLWTAFANGTALVSKLAVQIEYE